jgi:hypothetical protein
VEPPALLRSMLSTFYLKQGINDKCGQEKVDKECSKMNESTFVAFDAFGAVRHESGFGEIIIVLR